MEFFNSMNKYIKLQNDNEFSVIKRGPPIIPPIKLPEWSKQLPI